MLLREKYSQCLFAG